MAAPGDEEETRAPLLSRRSNSSSTLGSLHSDHPQNTLPPTEDDDDHNDHDLPPTIRIHRLSKRALRRRRTKHLVLRSLAFAFSVLAAFCAGSITVFSVYGHLFQSRLHYSQLRVNGVASAMSLSMYLPVPLVGYLCDRIGPGPMSFASAILAGGGYALAAGLYHQGTTEVGPGVGGGGATFAPMIFAFVAIGIGTASLYFSAITTCAKNFGKGRYRGFMLVAPIVAFGLGGMLLSQVGSRLLYERLPDGGKGDVNVFHFFLFLCVAFAVIGFAGTFTLRVIDEGDLIDGAVEELERSGLLEGSDVFRHHQRQRSAGYGATSSRHNGEDRYDEEDGTAARLLDPAKDGETDEDDESNDDSSSMVKLKKAWLLNAETRRFLSDPNMWLFTGAFFLLIGPGEAFMNNLGTVIGTLQTPESISTGDHTTTPTTQVSIMATVSAVARLLAASLSDLLSPTPENQYVQTGHPQESESADPSNPPTTPNARKISVSRITFFIISGIITSIGTIVLASGAVQGHGDLFWIVSGCMGAGYGAVFSLTPLIITVIYGVENVGTNFGIVALTPALGSVIWGLVYSAVYQRAAVPGGLIGGEGGGEEAGDGAGSDVLCYGRSCYAATFWAMTVSIWVGVLLVVWAWKGPRGWGRKGIVI